MTQSTSSAHTAAPIDLCTAIAAADIAIADIAIAAESVAFATTV
jgi:hypothetical protein